MRPSVPKACKGHGSGVTEEGRFWVNANRQSGGRMGGRRSLYVRMYFHNMCLPSLLPSVSCTTGRTTLLHDVHHNSLLQAEAANRWYTIPVLQPQACGIRNTYHLQPLM